MRLKLLPLALVLVAAAPSDDDRHAKAALDRLGARCAASATFTADFVRTSRAGAGAAPVVASGRMRRRRDPETLVLDFASPVVAVIHVDRASWREYRPDEKSIEEIDVADGGFPSGLLTALRADADAIAKAFSIRAGEPREGSVEVVLEPLGDELRESTTRLTLVIDDSVAPELREFAFAGPHGATESFRLAQQARGAEIAAENFDLRVPADVRVVRRGGAAARAALTRMETAFADVKSLSARFVQERRTALLDEPIRSSGRLWYRREPETLVLAVEASQASFVFLDAAKYRVYRPGDRQLEVFDVAKSAACGGFLAVFHPKLAALAESFRIREGASRPGSVEVVLEPRAEELRKTLVRSSVVVGDGEPALREFAWSSAKDEEARFVLTDLTKDGEVPPGTFDLRVPGDVRVLHHEAGATRDR